MPDLNLTQACVEVMTEEVIATALALTQAHVEVIASEPNLAFSLSQLTLETMVPVDQVLPDSGAVVSCFEIFPSEPLPETVIMTALSMEVTAVKEIAEADCVPYAYAWDTSSANTWTVNPDGTLYAPNLQLIEANWMPRTTTCSVWLFDPDYASKRWTIKLIYHNAANSKLRMRTWRANFSYVTTWPNPTPLSGACHLNLTALRTLELYSTFVAAPVPPLPTPAPDTETWVECIRIDPHDFGDEPEGVIIYD